MPKGESTPRKVIIPRQSRRQSRGLYEVSRSKRPKTPLARLGMLQLIASYSRQISNDALEPHAPSAAHRPRFYEIAAALTNPF